MLNIGINLKELTVSVIKDSKVVKRQDIPKEELKGLMSELCSDDEVLLKALRFCVRKLGSNKILFKGVHNE